jgi:hypothetical protein
MKTPSQPRPWAIIAGLAILLNGCSAAQAAMPSTSTPLVRVHHATAGDVTVQVTNAFIDAVTVSVMPMSGSCNPLPVQPAHGQPLFQGQSVTLTGNVSACSVGIMVQYKDGLAQTCTFVSTFDPTDESVSWAAYAPWTGLDTSCSFGPLATPVGEDLLTYNATL